MASETYQQDLNNNRIRRIQEKGGLRDPVERVAVEFFGHCAFRLTSPRGVTVLFDPWRNDPSGMWGTWFHQEFPSIEVDVTVMTHAHFDHDAIHRPDSGMILERLAGAFRPGDVQLRGVADKHVSHAPGKHDWTRVFEEFGMARPPDNPAPFDNVMYVVELGDVRILKWGDNRHDPPDRVWEAATRDPVDILFLPIDGTSHILSFDQIGEIVERVAPRIVVPEHYLVDGVSSTLAVLEDAERWVSSQRHVRRLDSGAFEVGRAELDSLEETRVWYFGHHHAIEKDID